MAQLPGTQFATAQPSGRTGQTLWNPPREGGGEQIAEGISKLGTVTLNYALSVQKQEMAAEYYEKRRLIDEAGWAAHNSVTGDEEADEVVWKRFQSDAQVISASSKYKDVNDELTQHVNQVSPNWQQSMRTAGLKIRHNNAKDQFRLNYEKSLEIGDMATATEMIEKQFSLKLISQAERNHYIATAPAQAHLLRANRLMVQGSYNLALDELAATDKIDLTTEQLKDKRTLTTYAKNQATELTNQQIQEVHELAAKNATPDVVKAKIDGSTILTPRQQTEAWEEYNHALSVRAKTGQNPYDTTQNWTLFEEDKRLALDKKIDALTIYSHEGATGYSNKEGNILRNIISSGGSEKDFEDSSAAKFLKELIDDFGRRYTLYQEVPVMREKGYGLLQEAIASAKTPLTDREKKELALRIFNNLQAEPITSAPGALLTPAEKAEELGQSLDKAVAENLAYRKTQAKPATIPQPQTQQEFDALPVGTRYYRADGSIWTKR